MLLAGAMTNNRLLRSRFALSALLLAGCAFPAQAETLQEALAAAYRDNPTLTAARAGQRATDETVNIQLATGRPTAQIQSQYSELAFRDPPAAFIANRTLGITAQANAPIYSGGRVRNNIHAAKTRVESGQFSLRGTELTVFSQVVAAYMDVIRTSSVVQLSRNNVQVLDVNLRATRDRFQVGALTRTDVAQSEARLAIAQGDLKTAEAQLIGARETRLSAMSRLICNRRRSCRACRRIRKRPSKSPSPAILIWLPPERCGKRRISIRARLKPHACRPFRPSPPDLYRRT